MASSKYIKSKSNYVLRSQHQVTKHGTVFERDFMTISGSDGMSPNEEQFYRSSNFKFAVRPGINENRKQYNDDWITADTSCLKNQTISKDSQIILNPDYGSISDFAYYGSAVNLVKSSIVDIALRFPAELYFTSEKSDIPGFTDYYVISNDYGIDIYTESVDDSVENKLRYMAVSYIDYWSYKTGNIPDECVCDITIDKLDNKCDGIIAYVYITVATINGNPLRPKIIVYKQGPDVYYLYNNKDEFGYDIDVRDYHLRPKNDVVDAFYDSIDDFERVLLNRDSVPKYTATFNTPYETEKGFFTYKRKYTWPSTYGWNPDLTGLGYETYVNDLIQLAEFYDEYNTNNLWRSMTHEAVKNLDWTFTRVNGDNTEEIETIDSSKVEPILKIWGRQYDDIKRYIDNIPKSLNVTLDKKNNVPDYFLDDVLNLSGWETTSLVLDDDITTPSLYAGGVLTGYNSIDANNEFLRRLKVFSSYLLSLKGTRDGLVSTLGLFGFEEGTDYDIEEKILIASSPTGTYPNFADVKSENKKKYNYVASDDIDGLYGLPLARVEDTSDENEDNGYVIPWYDRDKKYDGDLYFQSKGGWGKHDCEVINENEVCQYDDTVINIKTVESVEDLFELGRYVVKTGDICYVKDIINQYGGEEGHTNYFYLKDDEYANEPVVDQNGWINVRQEDMNDTTSEIGFKIAYLRSIVNNNQGNNPHTGEGEYDGGKEYVDDILNPFKMAYDGDNLIDTSVVDDIKFSGTTEDDNFRVWRFSLDDEVWIPNKTYSGYEPETRTSLFNPENNSDKYDEPASYSLLNLKNVEITFKYKVPSALTDAEKKEKYVREYVDFVKNKVLFYLKQMIPATTVFGYSFVEQQ